MSAAAMERRSNGRVASDVALFLAMGDFGSIRRLPRGSIYLEFPGAGKKKRRIWSMRFCASTIPFSEETARRVLEGVRNELARNKRATLDDAIAKYLPYNAPQNLVSAKLERWLALKRAEVRAGDRSPTYLAELERYAKPGGHFSFWNGLGIHAITYATLQDFSLWLADRGLGPKTRRNVLAGLRSFVGWLHEREEITELPRKWPWPKVPEHVPKLLTLAAQNAILSAIPETDRGLFLAMARMGIRPGEAVALDVTDCADGWLTVSRARKGKLLSAPILGTKSGAAKRLPVPEDLSAWITANVSPDARLRSATLFANPRTGGRYTPRVMQRIWTLALEAVKAPPISIYEGCKHSFATDAVLRGVSERALQAFLGHADVRSTRRYGRLSDGALIDVLQPVEAARRLQAARGEKK